MADLLSLHGWGHPSLLASAARQSSQSRSISASRRSPSPNKSIYKAKSTNALAEKAGPRGLSADNADTSLSTLRDPRAASTSDLHSTQSSSPHHPDLSSEVAALSEKLISAINSQTRLDDLLSDTRQELEASRRKVQELEAENFQYRQDVQSGMLIKRSHFEEECWKLRTALEEEKKQRGVVEKDKKNIEQELENLTAALFEEANKMVAAAKKEREAVERKNEQLRAQIQDTENLLTSQQEQLHELKSVLEQCTDEKENTDTHTSISTAPPTPSTAAEPSEKINRLLEYMNLSPATPGTGDICPAPSTSFSHLIKAVCRTDVQAYDDFHALIEQSGTTKPPSRATSGSYGGLNVMGLGALTGNSYISNGSSTSLSGQVSQNSSPSGNSSKDAPAYVPLKETRFFKRALTEDIEPTLRLDAAPSISWLGRRSILSSISEGNLVVEPMPPSTFKYSFPCSLCGERRKADENPRTHRFRTSEADSAQRYPLCVLCLEKVRSSCEFVGYLRMIKDGHLRIGDADEEKEAWEETVRLRERMFWSRIGGGVVPAFVQLRSSDKLSPSTEDFPPNHIMVDGPLDLDRPSTPHLQVSVPSDEAADVGDTSSTISVKRISVCSTISSRKENAKREQELAGLENGADDHADPENEEAAAQLKNSLNHALNGASSTEGTVMIESGPEIDRPVIPSKAPSDSKLRVTIPGAFHF